MRKGGGGVRVATSPDPLLPLPDGTAFQHEALKRAPNTPATVHLPMKCLLSAQSFNQVQAATVTPPPPARGALCQTRPSFVRARLVELA